MTAYVLNQFWIGIKMQLLYAARKYIWRNMKIIISSPNAFWNIDMECMKNIKKDIILLQFEEVQKIDSVYTIDVSVPAYGLGQNPGKNRGGRNYVEVKKHLPEILQYIERGEDVLILADINPQSVIIFDLLRMMTDGKNFKLHFWGIVPFHFEVKHRKTTYLDLLNRKGRVKSLHIKYADDFLATVDRRSTISQVLEKIKHDLEMEFPAVLNAIDTFKSDLMYFYDNQSKRYVDVALSLEKNKKKNFSDDLRVVMGEISVKYNPFSEEKMLIEQQVGRINGKKICQKLRQLRIDFAEANEIPYESDDCCYEGACAGTCEKCDSELKYLYNMIDSHPEKEPVYPYLEIESEQEKLVSVDSNRMMGCLKLKSKTEKETLGVHIPEFLRKKNE